MSTTSIADLNLDEQPIAAPPAKITPEDGAKALSTNVASGGDVQAEINPDDLNLPRINLVQKQSHESLVESFDFGDIVLNKVVRLAAINTVVEGVIVAKIKKQYQEKLEWDPSRSIQPKVFNTATEVREAGGSVVWGDDHFYEKLAHMLLIVPAPKDLGDDEREELFYYEFEGVHYARALFTVGGTGYNDSARDIFTALTTPALVTKGLRLARWQMKSFKKANPKNTWYGLSLKRSGINSDEQIAWSKQIAP